jgi:TusA-related sulfurtransferase
MSELLDVRLACCVLNRKLLRARLRQLSSKDTLEFISENTDVIKDQIRNIAEEENCEIIEINADNGSANIVVLRR